MYQFVREYWSSAAVALVAPWAVAAGAGVIAFTVTAVRHPERVREALRRLGRMFTD